jgi:putative ABC transport system permease protein
MIRHKGFSFINIAGLTTGIACSLLILLYIQDELQYDTFHPDAQHIYRVGFHGVLQDKKIHSAYSAAPLAHTLQRETPAVDAAVRITSWSTFPMRHKDRAFTEPNLLIADSNFFHFFHFTLLAGHPDSVLNGTHKVVITESAAVRYFDYKGPGDTSPIGKTMVLAQGYEAQVSGIAADPPRNSHFHFTFILSMDSWDEVDNNDWVTSRTITYFKLKPGTPVSTIEQKLATYVGRYINPELERLKRSNVDQFKIQGNNLGFFIQPLTHIHLYSSLDDEIEANSRIQYIYLFSTIAAFITLLACINYMNLSTARSASRAKEVGVRKTVGAPASRLIAQFLLESFFFVIIAVACALFIVLVMITPFNILANKQLGLQSLLSPAFLIGLPVFVLIVGLLAGSYPSFYLTTFSPVEVMRGRIRSRMRRYSIRNVLVVFQFFISSGLIVATLVVSQQLRYMQQASLGFDKHHVVNLLHTANLREHGHAFKKELLQHPQIVAASYCNRLPPNIDWQFVFSTTHPAKDYLLNVYEMDYDHLQAMKYKMVTGRFFSPDCPSDSTAVILNQRAATRLGLTSLANQTLWSVYGGNERAIEHEVIGIMQDFNFQSLRDSIQPMAIVLGKQPNWEMAIRIHPEDQDNTLELIRSLWKKHSPQAPFEYTFLDQNFMNKQQTEKRVGQIVGLFTILAILIACLGLFGLANFTAEQRIKEIGIRKVLGATPQGIIGLLNKDFLRLVLIANVLAWPVSWWLMHIWLNQFAYHIRPAFWVFVVATVSTFLIALVSVSYRAWKASQGNPVNSLRAE